MTIPQLGFGMLFGAICLLFILHATKLDNRLLGMALIATGIYLMHDAFGNRLLPEPNEVAYMTMAVVAGLVCATGAILLVESWRKSK